MRTLFLSLALFVAVLPSVTKAADAPRLFQSDGEDLAAAKAQMASSSNRMTAALKQIKAEADAAMTMKLVTVVDKPNVPPSGDKHDYTSLSPYWWPDPSKPDGKPYIRKDGEVNPERANYDLPHMEATAEAIEVLAMAYYLFGDERYAKRSADMIRAWFITPDTRMNPNCRYAQFIPGREEQDRAAGVIETNRLRAVVDADGLLHGSSHWPAEDSAKLKAWFKDFLTYLIESEQGKKEQAAPNNHGTFWGVQAATYALYLGEDELAKKIILSNGRDRIAHQIEPDGRQLEELERTKAFDYSRFNILAHEELAMLGSRVGLDLWNYQTDDGRSLRKAIDWMLPFITGEKAWEHKQITPAKMKEAALVLRRAANGYGEPRYEAAIAKMKEGTSPMADLIYPAKTKVAAP